MRIIVKISVLILFPVLVFLNISSCKKTPGLPSVITAEMTDITQSFATSGGTVPDDGGDLVTDSGICRSTPENPAISGNRKLCPVGWHVPGKEEWSALISFLGGEGIAGGGLKETGISHWQSPNYGADNESGFTGLPFGIMDGKFKESGQTANWWSTTSSNRTAGYVNDSYVLDFRYESISINILTSRSDALNVRCVKDR